MFCLIVNCCVFGFVYVCYMMYVSCILCLWQVCEDEILEFEFYMIEYCFFVVKGGVENSYGKVNILLQIFIFKGFVDSFLLVFDLGYVVQV